jgi:hypothetical protein
MPVSIGGIISASDYNNIRNTLSSVYNTAYGQTLRSSPVISATSKVTSLQLEELYLDAQGCFVHQSGSVSSLIDVPALGQTVGADTSQTFNQTTGEKATIAASTTSGITDYNQLVVNISNFDGITSGWPDSSFSLGAATTSARSTAWGNSSSVRTIYHVVTFTFSSLTARDYYFNTGGELRFSASLTSGAGAKDTDWANMLAAIGTVKFDKYRLTADSGTVSTTGYDALTATYQSIYTKTGSGAYSNNDYTIEGRVVSDTVLRFRVSIDDGATGTIDEPVGGTTTSIVNTFRPDSSFVYNAATYTAVSIPAPSIASAVTLLSNNGSAPA